MNKRIFYSDNGVLTDLSVNLNKYSESPSTFDYIAGEDYFFIGGRLPFNSLYFKMVTPNLSPSTMIVETWSGSGWAIVDDLIDSTYGLTTSGHIQFVPEDGTGWSRSDTDEGPSIEGLESLKIRGLYWLRISFSDDLDSGSALSWIGNIFSDDDDLAAEFPDLVKSNVYTSWKAGKSNWEEQHVRAADIIINDLQNNRVIIDAGQLLDKDDYRTASVQKTAEIIMGAFGDDFTDQRKVAREEYQRRLANPAKKIDTNANATEDISETLNTQGWLSR
jgi:hypothetical protein